MALNQLLELFLYISDPQSMEKLISPSGLSVAVQCYIYHFFFFVSHNFKCLQIIFEQQNKCLLDYSFQILDLNDSNNGTTSAVALSFGTELKCCLWEHGSYPFLCGINSVGKQIKTKFENYSVFSLSTMITCHTLHASIPNLLHFGLFAFKWLYKKTKQKIGV